MTKITMMDSNIEDNDIKMQEISGMGITDDTEDVNAEDLLFLINKTNSENKDAVDEEEKQRLAEKEKQKQLEEEEYQKRLQEENLKRFNEEQRLKEERLKAEAEETERQKQLELEKQEKSIKNRLKTATMKDSMPEANFDTNKISTGVVKTVAIVKKIVAVIGIFLLYNITSWTLAYFLVKAVF